MEAFLPAASVEPVVSVPVSPAMSKLPLADLLADVSEDDELAIPDVGSDKLKGQSVMVQRSPMKTLPSSEHLGAVVPESIAGASHRRHLKSRLTNTL